jgi:diguanylate cyclase (GGDEF)-like protein
MMFGLLRVLGCQTLPKVSVEAVVLEGLPPTNAVSLPETSGVSPRHAGLLSRVSGLFRTQKTPDTHKTPAAEGAGDGTRRQINVLSVRVRMLARWVETAAEMVREESGERVRELLARYMREELAVAAVRYMPIELSADPVTASRPSLDMPESLERVEITLNPGAEWGDAERALAATAVTTTDGMLAALGRLREAKMQSLTDPLTGLYNRRSLERMLEREVLLALRHHTPLSVVAIDIDHFKRANDTMGHAAGDEMLRFVAQALTHTLRRSDLAFRPGGDEFVVLLPQTNISNALAAMEKVRRTLAGAGPNTTPSTSPTISVGIAELWRGATSGDLLRAADDALYRAKNESRNCIRTHRAAA